MLRIERFDENCIRSKFRANSACRRAGEPDLAESRGPAHAERHSRAERCLQASIMRRRCGPPSSSNEEKGSDSPKAVLRSHLLISCRLLKVLAGLLIRQVRRKRDPLNPSERPDESSMNRIALEEGVLEYVFDEVVN